MDLIVYIITFIYSYNMFNIFSDIKSFFFLHAIITLSPIIYDALVKVCLDEDSPREYLWDALCLISLMCAW